MYQKTVSINLQQENKTGCECSLDVMWVEGGDGSAFIYEMSRKTRQAKHARMIMEARRRRVQKGEVRSVYREGGTSREQEEERTKQEKGGVISGMPNLRR